MEQLAPFAELELENEQHVLRATTLSAVYKTSLVNTRMLGRGNVAKVYHATMQNIHDGSIVPIACKCVKAMYDSDAMGGWSTEAEIIKALKESPDSRECPYLPRYYDTMCVQYDDFYMAGLVFMELLPVQSIGDLIGEHIAREELFENAFLLRTLHQMATALSICHKNHIAHMDFKSVNVLYDAKTERAILIDFNLSKYRTPFLPLASGLGTPMYAAPEISLDQPVDTFKADVWCFGQFCYELLALEAQFERTKDMRELRNILKKQPRAAESPLVTRHDPLYVKLLDSVLVYDNPKERWSFDEIVLYIEPYLPT
jgi:serine/threonine protein kinase